MTYLLILGIWLVLVGFTYLAYCAVDWVAVRVG